MSIKVCDLPIADRPHNRLAQLGGSYLTNVELLSLIIGTDQSIEIAQQIFSKFKTLEVIKTASIQELVTIKGIGKSLAGKIIACLEISKRFREHQSPLKKMDAITCPHILYDQLKLKISNYYKEHFLVCSLDSRNNLIAVDEISVGTLTSSLVHPREAFEVAIKRHAAHIIIAHNHPSGETDPSEDDMKVTRRLVDAGKVMGIAVLDHLIITQTSYLSFKEQSLL